MPNIQIPEYIADALTPSNLRLIIFPTEKCNLRCFYCYENFQIGKILPDVLSGVKNLISARAPDLKFLEISWFGGEPLLALNEILNVCSHAKSVSSVNPDLRYLSSMTTNGTRLSPETALKLADVGVRSYQVSLDGTRDIHNLTRVHANQKGSFDEIWGNLVSLRETNIDFEITIRVHYQSDTWEKLFPLIDDINLFFGEDVRYKVFFKSIVALGGKNDGKIIKIEKNRNSDILSELYGRLTNQSSKVASWAKGKYVCYAAKANALVIRADGAINKCTVALNDDRNVIGKINLDGTLSLDRNKLVPWLRGVETLSDFDLACPYSSHIKSKNDGVPIKVIHNSFP